MFRMRKHICIMIAYFYCNFKWIGNLLQILNVKSIAEKSKANMIWHIELCWKSCSPIHMNGCFWPIKFSKHDFDNWGIGRKNRSQLVIKQYCRFQESWHDFAIYVATLSNVIGHWQKDVFNKVWNIIAESIPNL